MDTDELTPDIAPAVKFHLREAARLRQLASTATTRAVKERLLKEAEQHESMINP